MFLIKLRADADDEGEEDLSPSGDDKLKFREIGQKLGNVARNLGAAAVAGLSLGGADTMVLHAQKAKGRLVQLFLQSYSFKRFQSHSR